MIALNLVLSVLLLLSQASASPLPKRFSIPHVNPNDILCQLPILKNYLCPRQGTGSLNRQTSIGIARGTADPSGVLRFSVRYANANRWGASSVVSAWNLPNGSTNVTALPLACPQPDVDSSTFTEDCLSMVIYVPANLPLIGAAPTMIWIHGGSFIAGSATAAGLDGSNLAIATKSIVAVVQYRLGALGFMAPNGRTNLAVVDIINAMRFLKKVVPAFGGNSSKITLAGQSSGANMIRALLATPSASSLFQSAILHSDPMDYGLLKPSTQQILQNYFNSLIDCSPTDSSCLNSLPLDTIINAEMDLFSNAINLDPSATGDEPMRPVRDGALITSFLDSTAPFPSVNKPIMVTNVKDETGFPIYANFPVQQAPSAFTPIATVLLGDERAQIISASPFYKVVPNPNSVEDARVQVQALATDYLYKCPSWTFARNWVKNGGQAFIGLFLLGASYPGNDDVPFCSQNGSVCHQDDIQIVFGTVANPSPAQSALISQMQKHYKAFLTTGNPNGVGVSNWNAATSSDVHALQLGGSGEVSAGPCDPDFWGSAVQYDYQLFYN